MILGEAIGLFVYEAELYFLLGTTNCHFPSWGLKVKLHKGQGLHVIWAGESSVNAVSTLQIHFVTMNLQ